MSPVTGTERAACLGEVATAADLAERLQGLDRDAWKALYLQHRRLVRGVLASRIGYGPDLEDLTQQVFATAATLVRDRKVVLRGEGPGIRAWIAAIAHRLGFAERRRHRAERAAPKAAPDDGGAGLPLADPEAAPWLATCRQVSAQLVGPAAVDS